MVNGIQKSKNAPSIEQSTKEELNTLNEIVTYTEAKHLADKIEEILECYQDFKQAIFQLLPDCELSVRKFWIAFKKDNHDIVDIEIQKEQLKICINAKIGQIDDPKNLLRDVSTIGYYGNGEYQVSVQDITDLEYIMSCIKQIL